MRHTAIINLYPNVAHQTNDLAFDANGAQIDCDPRLVDAEMARLQAAYPLKALRRERDALLAESDWTALADSALTSEVSAKWKLYRQRLRDFPSGLNTPAKVKAAKWPTKPV